MRKKQSENVYFNQHNTTYVEYSIKCYTRVLFCDQTIELLSSLPGHKLTYLLVICN